MKNMESQVWLVILCGIVCYRYASYDKALAAALAVGGDVCLEV